MPAVQEAGPLKKSDPKRWGMGKIRTGLSGG